MWEGDRSVDRKSWWAKWTIVGRLIDGPNKRNLIYTRERWAKTNKSYQFWISIQTIIRSTYMKFYNHQTTSINQMRKTALNAYVCWCNAQKINRKILTARGRSRIKSVKDGPSPNHPPNHEKIGPKNLTPPSPQKFTGWSQNLRSFTHPPTQPKMLKMAMKDRPSPTWFSNGPQ